MRPLGLTFVAISLALQGAAAVDSKQLEIHICKTPGKTKSVRTIKVESEAELCVVKYAKDQDETVVGRTRTLVGCKNIAEGIKKNLEAGQWNCRTSSDSKTTESQEAQAQ